MKSIKGVATTGCPIDIQHYLPRYALCCCIQGSDGQMWITTYNDHAQAILGGIEAKVVESYQQEANVFAYEKVFCHTCFKKFVFRLRANIRLLQQAQQNENGANGNGNGNGNNDNLGLNMNNIINDMNMNGMGMGNNDDRNGNSNGYNIMEVIQPQIMVVAMGKISSFVFCLTFGKIKTTKKTKNYNYKKLKLKLKPGKLFV